MPKSLKYSEKGLADFSELLQSFAALSVLLPPQIGWPVIFANLLIEIAPRVYGVIKEVVNESGMELNLPEPTVVQVYAFFDRHPEVIGAYPELFKPVNGKNFRLLSKMYKDLRYGTEEESLKSRYPKLSGKTISKQVELNQAALEKSWNKAVGPILELGNQYKETLENSNVFQAVKKTAAHELRINSLERHLPLQLKKLWPQIKRQAKEVAK